jgi:hypothetical protein
MILFHDYVTLSKQHGPCLYNLTSKLFVKVKGRAVFDVVATTP